MAAHVFPDAIRNRVRPRGDRFMAEMATQIIAKGGDRGVTFRRLFLKRVGKNGI
jgi:hypothetical protein